METEIYESDPFTAKRQDLLVRLTSEYRFEKGDELYLHQDGDRPLKVRLIDVRVHVQSDGRLTREILVLKV
ncbi:MAG: hypothetical protein IIC88_06000 [Chloroflexi bacterium]|nr:hypothetical protein [Chloroflexota bacterium]